MQRRPWIFRKSLLLSISIGLVFFPAARVVAEEAAAAKPIDAAKQFDTTVGRLLALRCLECHNDSDRKGGLDLSRFRTALAGGDSGKVLLAGSAEQSLLWQQVESEEMPPDESLTVSEKALLKEWIAAGAKWGTDPIDPFRYTTGKRAGYDWWALQPVARPPLPAVGDSAWPRTAIDRFVLAGLEEQGLSPSPEADRRTLIRRLSFDLLGLPPSPEDVRTFVTDRSPDAYARLVDRLLASPHHGERWARHWLDLARFGESQGFERDKIRPNAWRYRDWVVDAFNGDMPYDRFARLQLSGDVLWPDDAGALAATGFLVAGPYDEVGQSQLSAAMKAVVRQDELEDIVGTVGQTLIGLSVNCARCHDHKFDPILHVEYYRLTAALGGVRHGQRQFAAQSLGAETSHRAAALTRRIDAVARRLADQTADSAEKSGLPATDRQQTRREQLEFEMANLKSQHVRLTTAMVYAVAPQQPLPARVLARGNPAQQGDVVAAGGVAAIQSARPDFGLAPDAPEAQGRIELAKWIAQERNPLFSRVIVNRLWHYHFGTGLVDTPNDLGFSGGRPSHPELLDWLAAELVRRDWSLKSQHRLIVMSASYRQSSIRREKAEQVDAQNRLLWRKSPLRLEAEAVRDAALATAGQLNPAISGPGYQDFRTFTNNTQFYTPIDPVGYSFQRRSVYRTWIRSGRNPILDVFDCPDPSTTAPRRAVTTTPLQALALLNNSFFLRMADRFADRLRREAGQNAKGQVGRAFELAYSRHPRPDEAALTEAFIKEHGLSAFCRVVFNSNEFLYVD